MNNEEIILVGCTCPTCTTEDFRSVDDLCMDPECLWGEIDPECPLHGEEGKMP
jgi:hypothetical protein